MGTTAKTASGMTLQRGDGGTPAENFATIAMVTKIDGPTTEASEIDVTSFDSPSGYNEFIPGPKSAGTLTVELNLDETSVQYTNLKADMDANPPVTHNWKLNFPSPSTKKYTFAAFPNRLSHSFDPKGANKITLGLRISGAVTLG